MGNCIAIIEREGAIIPIIKGGDGPDADCMAAWPDRETAQREAEQVPMAMAYGVTIIDLDYV